MASAHDTGAVAPGTFKAIGKGGYNPMMSIDNKLLNRSVGILAKQFKHVSLIQSAECPPPPNFFFFSCTKSFVKISKVIGLARAHDTIAFI